MKNLMIVCILTLLASPCYAKKEEVVGTTRQECIDILIKLRELSPKTKLRINMERFQLYYKLYFELNCDEVIALNAKELKNVIKSKQELPGL